MVGAPMAGAWLAVMGVMTIGEQFVRRAARAHAILFWLLNVGYSLAALYLVAVFNGPAQTFGVALYGIVMFQILVRDYASPRRLLINLAPMLLAVIAAQGVGAHGLNLAHRQQPLEILTLLASPGRSTVLDVPASVQLDLIGNLQPSHRALSIWPPRTRRGGARRPTAWP